MYLPRFAYERPTTLRDASTLLRENAFKNALLGGGTDLLPRMKYGLAEPERLISLKGLEVAPPKILSEGELRLSGALTLAALASSPEVAQKAPLLAKAASKVATKEIRNVATLAGNLCQDTRCLYFNQSHTFQFVEPCFKRGGDFCYFVPKGKKCWAVYMSDTAPALICLGAKIEVTGSKGATIIDLENLYSGDPKHPLNIKHDDIVSAIIVPRSRGSQGCGFSKLTMREGIEFAALSVAVLLETTDDLKTCSRARITLGSVSSAPVRGLKGESLLEGESISKPLLKDVVREICKEVNVIPHHGYSRSYIAGMLKIEALNALTRAVNQLTGGR